ncbi:MAG TPA: NADH-quinone oxidoreductase subunit D, partial [Bacteroidota bacterium]|nr:NADH-quinone oxidoreductase subunit D [Bacteroidota bacterium]
RIREMEQSLNIIEQALDRIPQGDVRSAIPKRIRPPAGDVYVRSESPRGEIGFYLVSDGTASPYRLKARSPAFVNLSVCPEICRGYMIADIVAIVGSVDIVLGEVDR